MKDKSDVSSKLEAKWKSASENAIESGENHQPFLEGQRTVKYAPLYRQVRLSLFLGFVGEFLWGQLEMEMYCAVFESKMKI
jgi:hypothetical protein